MPLVMKRMPRIGMRLIKTAVAVFLCFLIDYFREAASPFYSAIAAILCMQPELEGSFKAGKERLFATVIGGAAGTAFLALERGIAPLEPILARYFVVSVLIIVLMYITVLINMSRCASLACVVFLSIVVPRVGSGNVYVFALNRVVDTLIGMFVALGINALRVPHRKMKDLLFVCDCEAVTDDGGISQRTKLHLSRLLREGARILFVSSDIPARAIPQLETLPLKYPVVILDGAATYDTERSSYAARRTLPPAAAESVLSVLKARGMNCFIYVISRGTLHIYYGPFRNKEEERYYEETRALLHNAYIYEENPYEIKSAVCCIKVADTHENLSRVKEELSGADSSGALSVSLSDPGTGTVCGFLTVRAASASAASFARDLSAAPEGGGGGAPLRLVSLIADAGLSSLEDSSDMSYAWKEGGRSLTAKAQNTFVKGAENGAIKRMETLYWGRARY